VIKSADAIRKAWLLFNDEISRNEYLAQIHWRLNPEFAQIPAQAGHEIYFPPDLIKLNENEVFVDCGAYTGDTVRSFFQQANGQFQKILTFEPDPANFKELMELVTSLPWDIAQRIKTSDLALGCRSEQLYFNAQGVASSSLSASGSILIQSEPLDSLLADELPTYIKMDIEGAEIDALEGATRTISTHLPILAISVYHLQDHIWNVPLLIHSLSDSYKFYLRRYTPRVLDDLVLYAIPTHRKPA
jgi:FkbM family methyltransferase